VETFRQKKKKWEDTNVDIRSKLKGHTFHVNLKLFPCTVSEMHGLEDGSLIIHLI